MQLSMLHHAMVKVPAVVLTRKVLMSAWCWCSSRTVRLVVAGHDLVDLVQKHDAVLLSRLDGLSVHLCTRRLQASGALVVVHPISLHAQWLSARARRKIRVTRDAGKP